MTFSREGRIYKTRIFVFQKAVKAFYIKNTLVTGHTHARYTDYSLYTSQTKLEVMGSVESIDSSVNLTLPYADTRLRALEANRGWLLPQLGRQVAATTLPPLLPVCQVCYPFNYHPLEGAKKNLHHVAGDT